MFWQMRWGDVEGLHGEKERKKWWITSTTSRGNPKLSVCWLEEPLVGGCSKWRKLLCVNSYRFNSSKQDGAVPVYLLKTGGIHKIHFSRPSVCVSNKMNLMVCVSSGPRRCMNVYVRDSLHRNLCLLLWNVVFVCFCFHFNYVWVFFFPSVCFSLRGLIPSRINAFKNMHYKFLIRCVLLPSHMGSQYNMAFTSPGILCVPPTDL